MLPNVSKVNVPCHALQVVILDMSKTPKTCVAPHARARSTMGTKIATCTFCDGGCALAAEEANGRLRVSPADPAFPAICSKAHLIDEYRLHPDRVTSPLRRIGPKGSGRFEKISWDEALDEIADRLQSNRQRKRARSDCGVGDAPQPRIRRSDATSDEPPGQP